jgi:hypothetical protein
MQSKLPVFSKNGYAAVLKSALNKGFSFIWFSEMNGVIKDSKYCLMRHDIDTSLKCALEMAELENVLGVRSTYFFMLRSPAYNLFSRYAFDVLNRIKELGHEIGLHFDAAHPTVINKDIKKAVLSETQILSNLIERTIHSVSFHQPSRIILEGDLLIPGLLNTYNKEQMKDWYYTSDSNRVWKQHNAFSVYKDPQHSKIQILIHPIWWMNEDVFIEDAWNSALKDNFYIMQKQFLETEGAYGPERIFLIERA